MIRTGAINWRNPVKPGGLNDGLVSWWLARGPWVGGGTWFDLCGKTNGTFANGAAWSSSTRIGGRHAITFDGSDDVMTTATLPPGMAYANPFTATMWVRDLGSGSLKGFFHLIEGTAETTQLGTIYFDSSRNGFLAAHGKASTTGGSVKPSTAVTTTQWNHVTLSHVGGTGAPTLYVNGVQNSTADGADLSPWGNSQLTLGRGVSGSFYANCQLDDVRLFNRVLSAGDIWKLYEDSLAGYPQTLNRLERRVGYVAAAAGLGFNPLVGGFNPLQGFIAA